MSAGMAGQEATYALVECPKPGWTGCGRPILAEGLGYAEARARAENAARGADERRSHTFRAIREPVPPIRGEISGDRVRGQRNT